MTTLAQIKNGVVKNTIIASLSDVLDPNFTWIDITNLSPRPGVGWAYDGVNFSDPNGAPEQSLQDKISSVILAAKIFGENLFSQFGAENVLLGATEEQMDDCLTTLAPVINSILTGSLKIAIIRINQVQTDNFLLTAARITKYRNLIEDYLGIPRT